MSTPVIGPDRMAARSSHRGAGSATLSRTRRPGPVLLGAVVGVLGVIGLVMVLSASSVQSLREHGSSWYFFKRQVLWMALGLAAFAVTAHVDYRRWRRWGAPLLVVSVVLLVVVLIPGVGIRAGGSSRWLGRGTFRMQPSEAVKLALLLFSADVLARPLSLRSGRSPGSPLAPLAAAVRPVLLTLVLVAALLFLQPDLGTTLVVAVIVLVVLFVAGTPLRTMATLCLTGTAATLVLIRIEPYRWRRVTAFIDPWADAGNTGYQAAQGLVALGSGRLTGVNLGASRAKWGFLPAAHTDFIFAIIGEELGLLGTLAVVALFALFAVAGVRAALRAPDRYGTLLAAGVTAWVIGQAVLNIGAVTGVLPITGVPLPFVSAGGSALVVLMAATGILLNIARQEARTHPRAAG